MNMQQTTDPTSKQVCEDIIDVLNKLKTSMVAIADDLGITRIQLFAVYSINKTGQLPMGQFADVLHCDPSNVTGIVDRLVSQGLVIRQECATDRRSRLLVLTPKGQDLVDVLERALPQRMGCDSLTAAEREALHGLLQKIASM